MRVETVQDEMVDLRTAAFVPYVVPTFEISSPRRRRCEDREGDNTWQRLITEMTHGSTSDSPAN